MVVTLSFSKQCVCIAKNPATLIVTVVYDVPAGIQHSHSHFPLRVVANRVDEHIDRIGRSQQLSCPDGPDLAF